MNLLFIMIEKKHDNYGSVQFNTRNSDREVLHYVGIISARDGLEDTTSIERIFSVNEYGKVTTYEVVFKNGKLKLEAEPEVK